MSTRLPLSALLSQAYVAFTLEFDNEFERLVPHRTTEHGHTPGHPRAPWLVSMAMWIRFLRFVPDSGIFLNDLQSAWGLSRKGFVQWFTRLSKWWSYLRIENSVLATGSKPAPTDRVLPTEGGLRALAVLRTLTPIIEDRWSQRFGTGAIGELTSTLRAIAGNLPASSSDFFALFEDDNRKPRAPSSVSDLSLPQLLAKVLLAFARDYDAVSTVPLALSSNVLRVTGNDGVLVRDLPRLTSLAAAGVDAEGRILIRRRLAAVAPDPTQKRARRLSLTSSGKLARDSMPALADRIESAWHASISAEPLEQLRNSLEAIADPRQPGHAKLIAAIAPPPGNWRASLPPLESLPWFPAVAHRGGFPDGA